MTARFSSIALRSSGSSAAESSRRSSSATAASYSAVPTGSPRSATVTAGAVSSPAPEIGSSTAPVIGSSERGADAVGPSVPPPSRTAIQTAPADRSAIAIDAAASCGRENENRRGPRGASIGTTRGPPLRGSSRPAIAGHRSVAGGESSTDRTVATTACRSPTRRAHSVHSDR